MTTETTSATDAKTEALQKAEALKTSVLADITTETGATLDELVINVQASQKAIKPVIEGLLEDGVIGIAKGVTRSVTKADGKETKPAAVYVEAGKVNSFLEFSEIPVIKTVKLSTILKLRPAVNQRDTASRLKKEHLNGVASASQHVFRIGMYPDTTGVVLDGNSRIAAYKAGNLFYEFDDNTPVILEIYQLADVEQEKSLYHEFDSTFSVMSSRDLDYQAKAELNERLPQSKTMNKSIKSAVSFATGKSIKVGVGIYDDVKEEIFFLDDVLQKFEPEKAIDGSVLSALLKFVKENGMEDSVEDFAADVLLALTDGVGIITNPEETLKAFVKVNTNRTYGSARATAIYDALVKDYEAR